MYRCVKSLNIVTNGNCCDLNLTVNVGLLGVAWFKKTLFLSLSFSLAFYFYNFIVKFNVVLKREDKIVMQIKDLSCDEILQIQYLQGWL